MEDPKCPHDKLIEKIYHQFWRSIQTLSPVSLWSLIERAVVLLIMHVETFKTDDIFFSLTSSMCLSVHWAINSSSQSLDTDNINRRDQRCFMVFNSTFNNISVMLWLSVLLVKETRVPAENHWSATSHWQTLSHNVVSSTPHLSGIRTHNVSGDRKWLLIGSCKSNYHTITTPY